jgi:hypothetical protein
VAAALMMPPLFRALAAAAVAVLWQAHWPTQLER